MKTSQISTILSQHSAAHQAKLQALRDLIHATADITPEITELEESLKWGQPSFIVKPKGIGSTVRIDKKDDGVSIYFICTTGLIDKFREIYPDAFNYMGNREIHFALEDDLNEDELAHCIAMALTYHLNKKRKP